MIRYLIIFALSLLFSCKTSSDEFLAVPGLEEPVDVIRDAYGVNHIFAKNEHDLFFSQGYCAAKDRLFQFEIWRRQASGTTAEVFGAQEVMRDIGTRLFKYRGDLDKELNHYHPHGKDIISAFTDGINAYIREALQDTALLPIEFKLLGIKPGIWSPELVISRHQGLLGNITDEVRLGRAVARIGTGKVKSLNVFEPGDPDVSLDPKLHKEHLFDSVIELYDAFRKPFRFRQENLMESLSQDNNFEELEKQDVADYNQIMSAEKQNIGSNNWVISGKKSLSGFPILANDPHRGIAVPSLRYMVHLNAPGWNVVGGGEPTIPGVSIGHNDNGAWGLTIFAIDGEDLYEYEINPSNKNQYKYNGQWEDMKVLNDTIHVKGGDDVYVELKYTRHGPVTLVDEKNHIAYAVRCGWLEPGGAPYLASLRMDQAKNWDEFREACSYSHIPGENMVWADREGTIGWQAVGIAPIRKKYSGLVPVPGDGSYEWDGYLPIKELPHIQNPDKGFWATANENCVSPEYDHNDAIGRMWADRFRANRINEVLGDTEKFSQEDMMKLQFDYLSHPARTLVPLLKNLPSKKEKVENARQKLLAWNYLIDKNSIEAGIYVAWEKKMASSLTALAVPDEARKYIRTVPLTRILEWISGPGEVFRQNKDARDAFLLNTLEDAIASLEKKLGPEMEKWVYGQAAYHHTLIKHPLSNVVNDSLRKILDTGPLPRSGYGATPGMTSNTDNQASGASFRIVADLSNWEKTVFTNTPGQSGDPRSPYYKNLFEMWANDQHFPVHFSRAEVEKAGKEKIILRP